MAAGFAYRTRRRRVASARCCSFVDPHTKIQARTMGTFGISHVTTCARTSAKACLRIKRISYSTTRQRHPHPPTPRDGTTQLHHVWPPGQRLASLLRNSPRRCIHLYLHDAGTRARARVCAYALNALLLWLSSFIHMRPNDAAPAMKTRCCLMMTIFAVHTFKPHMRGAIVHRCRRRQVIVVPVVLLLR